MFTYLWISKSKLGVLLLKTILTMTGALLMDGCLDEKINNWWKQQQIKKIKYPILFFSWKWHNKPWSNIGGDLSERPEISLDHVNDVVLDYFHSLGHNHILDIEFNLIQDTGLEVLLFTSFRKFGQTMVRSRFFHFNHFSTFPGLLGNLGVFFLFGRHLGLKKIRENTGKFFKKGRKYNLISFTKQTLVVPVTSTCITLDPDWINWRHWNQRKSIRLLRISWIPQMGKIGATRLPCNLTKKVIFTIKK